MAKDDMTGFRFGKLVVLMDVGGGYVQVKCDCGTVKNTRKQYIRNGQSRSCGCGRYEQREGTQPIRVGDVFERFTVEQLLGSNGVKREILCRCACGVGKVIPESDLRAGTIKSCGCFRRDRMGTLNRTHGEGAPKGRTALYRIWGQMRTRCSNPTRYPSYVGRTVWPDWQRSFEPFRDYVNENLGPRPPGASLDRIDNDRGYEPGNLRWATSAQQARNRSSNINVTANGVTKCIADWARDLGCEPATLHARIRNGWSPENAVTVAVRPQRIKPA